MAWFGMIIMMFDLLVVAPHFKRVSRIFSRSTAPIHGKGAFGQLSAASSGSGFKGLGVEGLRYSEPERLRKGGVHHSKACFGFWASSICSSANWSYDTQRRRSRSTMIVLLAILAYYTMDHALLYKHSTYK